MHNLRINPVFSAEVNPPFSYKPDPAFLAGLNPEESGSGAYYLYDPENPVFSKNKWLLNLLPQKPVVFNKISKRLLQVLLRFNGYGSTAARLPGNVPFKYYGLFTTVKSGNLYPPGNEHGVHTIYREMSKTKMRFIHFGVPNSTGKLIHMESETAHHNLLDFDVISFFISDLDQIGHTFGGSSVEYRNTLEKIIVYINRISGFFGNKGMDPQIIIFGDHGMADITRSVNIQEKLNAIRAKPFKDYIYFLDSTLARFWFNDPAAREEVFNTLYNNKYGSWVNSSDKIQYKINLEGHALGEEIWWASGGTLISPNFWQGNRLIKGMHGYRHEVTENNTLLLSSLQIDLPGKIIPMTDIHGILRRFIGLA